MNLIPRVRPTGILDDTDALIHNAEKYFSTEQPWTGEGLARALGFASYKSCLALLAKHEQEDTYPKARWIIERALSIIADDMIKGALITDYNASFTRFILSAHHGLHEKTIQETHETSDSRIVIQVVRPDTQEFHEEVDRLRAAALPARQEADSLEDIL